MMISSWRRKRSSRASKQAPAELVIPNHFRCPISLELMKDPVTLSTGMTYDRESIEKWIEAGNVTCPVTNQVLKSLEPIPNHTIRRMIQDWCVDNQSHGVERIPTPRIPISSNEVLELLERIVVTRSSQEARELLGRISRLMKESERNRKCIVANGAAFTLATAFQSFSDGEGEGDVLLLEDILCGLTSMLPLDPGALASLKAPGPLGRLVWFLRRGGLSGRRNAVLVLKELVSSSKDHEQVIGALVEMEGAIEGLVKLIKEPICPASTKASLSIIYHTISSTPRPANESIIARLIDMGLVSLIIEILVDAEKSISEKALGVLDGICRSDMGIEAAYCNALTVPVVVKKILRVSDLATEFSVSILWRLCDREGKASEGVVVEALQVGAFQKLLLILQVGWNISERTKEKVTKLLKVLNLYRDRVECIESMDFKGLKRSF